MPNNFYYRDQGWYSAQELAEEKDETMQALLAAAAEFEAPFSTVLAQEELEEAVAEKELAGVAALVVGIAGSPVRKDQTESAKVWRGNGQVVEEWFCDYFAALETGLRICGKLQPGVGYGCVSLDNGSIFHCDFDVYLWQFERLLEVDISDWWEKSELGVSWQFEVPFLDMLTL